MLKSYFKTAWRNLAKNKFYSFINISGLSIGLAVGILILLWVQDELGYNGFHKNAANIYKLENMAGTGTSRQIWTNTTAPIGILAQKEIPGIQGVVRMSFNNNYHSFQYNQKQFTQDNTFYTDPSLFSIFDFKIIKGNAANPFTDNNSIVITESTAKKYFGNAEPIGKVITAEGKENFAVSGVVKDIPENSSIRGDMFFPMTLLAKNMYAGNTGGASMSNDFTQFNYDTYLLLQPGLSLSNIATKLRQIHLKNKPDDTDVEYMLMPLMSMHLYHSDGSDGGIESVRMFMIIAVLILLIACINYVNLSTARSMLRAKEVSLRKIVGAAKIQLFLQFIIETALLFLLATVIALALIYVLMPLFNQISGKQLLVSFTDVHIWQVVLVTIISTLIISSIYPALLLSSFEPIKAMKGKMSSRISDALFRKILVVTQFAFSVVLITGTMVISNQLEYIRSKQLGYDKSHVFSFWMRDISPHFDAVKSDLLKQPGVLNVTSAGSNIVSIGGQTGDNQWDGKQVGETMMLSQLSVDNNFIPFFNMQLLQGENFNGTISDSTHFILNEAAVKAARLTDPIGKKFRLWKTEGTIIGVVKDFHFASMRRKIEPAIFYYRPDSYGQFYIKTTGKDAPKAIAAAEKKWKEYNAGIPFSYAFLDDTFNSLYQSEQRTGLLFNIFAAIAICISCLGLLGLAAYTAQIRTREIGVRKVLGASVAGITQLLAKDFIKLVGISIIIATPIAWYVMNKWLQNFAYKVQVSWTVFVVAGIAAILIAIITISTQSIKAALANPVKSLRSE